MYSKKKGSKDNFDVMIVDESSMIDINLILELLLSIPDGTSIIFIGDADQAKSWAEDYGVNMFFVGSEHSFMRNKANEISLRVKEIS